VTTAANWFTSAAVVIPVASSRLGPATVWSFGTQQARYQVGLGSCRLRLLQFPL